MNASQWNKQFYYVDKTFIVKTFLKMRHKVTLISAPQGFLKTSNLNLLASFLGITSDPKADLKRRRAFENTKIMSRHFIVQEYFGRNPIVFLTFNHNEIYTLRKMVKIFRQFYKENDFLLTSPELTHAEKRIFRAYLEYEPTTIGSSQLKLVDAIAILCGLLHKHYGKKVYVFVDNYDAPILDAISNNRPMYNFLPFLERMLTNIATSTSVLRLTLTGITSISRLGSVNMAEFKFLANNKLSKYFGFTQNDLEEVAVKCSTEILQDLKKSCYRTAAGTKIYSPEWILNYLNYSPIEHEFWYENILKKQVYDLSSMKRKIRLLLQGEDLKFNINKHKSEKDLWLTNKLMNGSLDEELEEAETSLLFSLFLEFGLFTFAEKSIGGGLSLFCLTASEEKPKIVLNFTSRGSKVLKNRFT